MSLEFEPWPFGLHSRGMVLARDLVGAGKATEEHVAQLVRILQRTELADYPLQQIQAFAHSVVSTFGPIDQDPRTEVVDSISDLETVSKWAERLFKQGHKLYNDCCELSDGRLTPREQGDWTSGTDRKDLLDALGEASRHFSHDPPLVLLEPSYLLVPFLMRLEKLGTRTWHSSKLFTDMAFAVTAALLLDAILSDLELILRRGKFPRR